MKHIYLVPTVLALLSVALPAAAVDIVQCEDSQGHRTFEAHCPPGTTQVGQKDYRTNVAPAESDKKGKSEALTGVLYVVPDCSSCDQVKEFLQLRHISVTEKNVKDDVKLQEELKKKSGELRVPTLVIGDQVVTGSSRPELLNALTKAGYQPPENEGQSGAGNGGENDSEGNTEQQ